MPSTHAEISAISKIIGWKNKPKSISICVIKLSNIGTYVNSKPCFHCLKFIKRKNKHLNIKYIYYSTSDGIVCEKISDITTDYITSGIRNKNLKEK